jgi:hypothetical protein
MSDDDLGNGLTLPPKPDGPVQVLIVWPKAPVIEGTFPVHHTQGAKTIPGPVLTEPER